MAATHFDIPITTGNEVPGWEVSTILGPVFGMMVRSRNVGANIGASFKALAGGELKGLSKNLEMARMEALDRMVGAAKGRGANAIIAMRFDCTAGELGDEVCAYGTAVQLSPPKGRGGY